MAKRLGFFAALAIFLMFSVNAFAQGISNVSNNMVVDDADAVPGSIVTVGSDGKIVRATKPYDSAMLGVVVEFPVISIGEKTDNTKAVLSAGKADVLVSAVNGEIKAGDFITSSESAGVAVKATIPGYVFGKALASYSDTSQNGVIPVLVDIGVFAQNPNVSGLLGQFLNSFSIGLASTESFPLMLRYVAAALIAGITFIIASFSFIRFMRSGIEAMGRNPLAKGTIVAGMILNGVIVLVLCLAGFGVAFAIIAF